MSDNEIRRRTKAQGVEDAGPTPVPKVKKSPRRHANDGISFGVLDIIRILVGLLVLSSALSWFVTGESVLWGWKPWFSNVGAVKSWLVCFALYQNLHTG